MTTLPCKTCTQQFAIADEDKEFYKKMEVPEPTNCPACRQRRRLAIRNEIYLYKRKCDLTGESIISMYSQDKPYTVYEANAWHSDKWDPMQYGRDYDFTRPFFEQFAELQQVVPRMALVSIGNQNSDFTSYALRNKDSYLVFTADYNEDCIYGRFSSRSKMSMDFDFTDDSVECYETMDVKQGNRCFFSQKCTSSSDLYFCYDMRNCHNCIGCANLRNQQYHVFNKKVTPEEYAKIKKDMNLGSYTGLLEARQKAAEHISKYPRKLLETIQCEDCLGDYLRTSKNAQYCFDSYDLFDVKYGTQIYNVKDSYDWDFVGAGSEFCYEMCSSAYELQNCKFVMNSWEGGYNLQYCDLCLNNKDLFGCVGLRKKQYCILNKQYTQQEYEELVPKIIEHMKSTGEYGEFFPISISPYGYNETVANEYFPITKEQALESGLKWKDEEDQQLAENVLTIDQVPDHISEVQDSITDSAIVCPTCGKQHKITPQELKFYKKEGLALPRECWKCRHKRRMATRNPRTLYERPCGKCGENIQSTYNPEGPYNIYCEKCYLAEVE